jgi:hypothetical protein
MIQKEKKKDGREKGRHRGKRIKRKQSENHNSTVSHSSNLEAAEVTSTTVICCESHGMD